MGMDVYGLKPKNEDGKYFRASIWSWHPIHALCEHVLGMELPWSTNDGYGFKCQTDCNNLADKLNEYLQQQQGNEIGMPCQLLTIDKNGKFIPLGTPESESPYKTTRSHIEAFIRFLYNCGGFEIC